MPQGDLQASWKQLWYWMSGKSDQNTSYQTVSKSKHLQGALQSNQNEVWVPYCKEEAWKTFLHLPPENLDVLLQSGNRPVENALNYLDQVACSYLSALVVNIKKCSQDFFSLADKPEALSGFWSQGY